MKSMKK